MTATAPPAMLGVREAALAAGAAVAGKVSVAASKSACWPASRGETQRVGAGLVEPGA